jgi:asparaginyl-tRNA synthetase
MNRTKIFRLLDAVSPIDSVMIKGWVRSRRDAKEFSFLEINDGSCLKNIQVITTELLPNYPEIKKISTGSAVAVAGRLVRSMGLGQNWEIQSQQVDIISLAPEAYPLQKKRHSDEFLRTIAHLRPRTNKYGAIFRIRSELAFAIHKFFKDRGFFYIHTPIITGSDCEGAGEMFRVTTMNMDHLSAATDKIDYSLDFFGKETNLTVSGQLSAEMLALALGDVYTFGPTFRAENSNTSRHAAEFWMIEPEMAFCDLSENMALGEALIKYLTGHILASCGQDMELLSKFVEPELPALLENILNTEFVKIPYAEAVNILKSSKRNFEYAVELGKDLHSEHERYLTEEFYKQPIIVYDFPKSIKPFYMRQNDDGQTVAAMDILVPKIGEIIGGSQREERLAVLESRIDELGLNTDNYWWYLDSRRYGSVPHSGFGMGFERMMMLITGVKNIRDVIPFPRTPKNIEF